MLATFLDLTAAFKFTWHFGILYKQRCGVKGACFQYLRSFLEGRRITVKVDGVMSNKESLECGTPQGLILSPFLIFIIINCLPEALSDSGKVISLLMTLALEVRVQCGQTVKFAKCRVR